jgi:hypothetical protein
MVYKGSVKEKKYQKEYRKYNKVKSAEYNKRFEEKHGTTRGKYVYQKNLLNPEAYWKRFQTSLKMRNRTTELSYEEFKEIIKLPCYLCGESEDHKFNGIDRINTEEDYTKTNCRPCCSMCNFMKSTYDLESFLWQCAKITQHHNESKVM